MKRPLPVTATSAWTRARYAIASAFFVHGAIAGSWATTIPAVKSDLSLGEAALGGALLGPALGAILAMPVSGAITARCGSRVVTRVMLIVDSVALIAVVLAPNLPMLFVSLVVLGAAGGAMDVAMNAQGVALERRAERPILSSFHGIWSLGGFAGGLTAGAAADAGWTPLSHILLVSCVVAVVGSVGTRGLLPSDTDRSEAGPRFARPTAALALLGAVAFCAMLAEGAALDWSAVYLRETLQSSRALAAVAVASFSLGMALGRFLGDRLVANFGHANFARGAGTLAAAGLSIVVFASGPVVAIVGFALLGSGLSSIVPVVFSRAGRSSGGAGATGIAAVASVGYVSFLVAPALVGGAAELTSLRVAMALVGLFVGCIPFLAGRLQS